MSHRKRNTIGGQFAPRLIEMLASPAYRALSQSGHRVLARLEIELGNHGGNDNGRLPVTYGDFQRYGIERKSIAPALREVQALGFAIITERGRPSESDFGRHPNYFEITYVSGAHGEEPTHEWKRHKSVIGAKEVARLARRRKDEEAVAKSQRKAKKKLAAGVGKIPNSGPQFPSDGDGMPGPESPPTNRGPESPPTIYISGEGDAA